MNSEPGVLTPVQIDLAESVAAVVVTHNRKLLLAQCLNALLAQTRPPQRILVLDNASSDGTAEMIECQFNSSVVSLRLPENVGGAGGFSRGIAWARDQDYDWIWVMDDDTIPAPDALAELLGADLRVRRHGGEPPAILASKAIQTGGELHPMNIPWLRQVPDNQQKLCTALQVLPIRECSFVSALMRTSAVHQAGLPCSQFFIWADDLEYTGRILRHNTGYWAQKSVVLHATANKYLPPAVQRQRITLEVRNKLWTIMYSPAWTLAERFTLFRHLLFAILRHLRQPGIFLPALGSVLAGLGRAAAVKPDFTESRGVETAHV